MSSVEPKRGGEAGGLQGTSLNLGASLGVALVGSILLATLATNFTHEVEASPTLPDSVKQQVSVAAQASANFVSTTQVETGRPARRPPAAQTDGARGHLLRRPTQRPAGRLAFLALFALLALAWVRRLPSSPPTDEPVTSPHDAPT